MLLTNNGALTITSTAVDPNDVAYQGGIAVKASTGQVYVEGGGGIGVGRTITASTTAVLEDAGTQITFSHATVAGVISIDNDATITWPAMAIIGVYQKLAAACTFAAVGASGVTIRGTPSGLVNAIQHVGTDEWVYL